MTGLRRVCAGIVWIAILVPMLSTAAWSDGGELAFRQVSAATEVNPFVSRYALSITSSALSEFELVPGEKEEVYVFEIGGHEGTRLWVSKATPHRIFSDLNFDGVSQPEEIVTAVDDRFGYASTPIRIAQRIGEAVITVEAHVWIFAFDDSAILRVENIVNGYGGELPVGGRVYPSRIYFTQLDLKAEPAAYVIVLDSNSDGRFEKHSDIWFNGDGIACFNGSFMVADTTLEATRAVVELRPYNNALSSLELKGSGLKQVSVTLTPEGQGDARPFPVSSFALPSSPDGRYTLPAGRLRVDEATLDPGNESGHYYRMTTDYENTHLFETSLSPEEAATLHLGGPLTQTVSAHGNWLLGTVSLSFEGWKNEAGVEYNSIMGATEAVRYEAPKWEIRDASGSVIRSGKFEYG